MSDFLFVIPPEWREIDIVSTGMGAETIASIIATSVFVSITEMLRINSIISEDEQVIDARLFNNEVFIIKTELI